MSTLVDKVTAFLKNLANSHRPGEAQNAAGPYRGGEVNRLNKGWQPERYSGDGAAEEGRDLLARRLQDLTRNDPAVIGLRRALVDHVVGTGIGTWANVRIAGDLDEEFNSESDDLWEEYAINSAEADVRGKLAWSDMQRQMMEGMLDEGDALLLRCGRSDPGRLVPTCFQVIEAAQLDVSQDRPRGGPQGNKIKGGIELDRWDTAVAYWLFDTHPDDPHAEVARGSRRVPASRVVHLQSPGRASQTRGISLYAAITQTARDLDNYLGAELTAANIGALFTLVHKCQNPGTGFGFSGDGSDENDSQNPVVRLGRGIVSQIGKDDEIEQVASQRPNPDAGVFTKLILLLMSMGGGVSRYRVTRDYTGTTYIAARAARLDDQASFSPLQNYIGRAICLPVRRLVVPELIAYGHFGSVTSRQFRGNRRRWQRLELQPPGVPSLDEEKEIDAALAGRGGGILSLKRICGRLGWNHRREMDQIAAENEYARKKGVELNFDRPSTPAAAKPRQEEEQPAEDK